MSGPSPVQLGRQDRSGSGEAAEIRSRWAVEVALSTFNDAGHVRDDVDSTDDGRHHAVSLGRAKMRS